VTDSAYDVRGLERVLKNRSSIEQAQWKWRDDNPPVGKGWTPYKPEQNSLLEATFVEGKVAEVHVDKLRKVDMKDRNQIVQRVIADPGRKRNVRRHTTRVQLSLNKDGDGARPKVFVVAAKQAGKSYKQQLLRNYRGQEPDASQILGMDVWQAGRATSAAPSYFPPFKMGESVFVDGGIKANNPVMVALEEATNLWPGREVGCIVSLGCGQCDVGSGGASTGAGGVSRKRLTKSLSDTEPPHTECLQKLNVDPLGVAAKPNNTHKFTKGAVYMRLNPTMEKSYLLLHYSKSFD